MAKEEAELDGPEAGQADELEVEEWWVPPVVEIGARKRENTQA